MTHLNALSYPPYGNPVFWMRVETHIREGSLAIRVLPRCQARRSILSGKRLENNNGELRRREVTKMWQAHNEHRLLTGADALAAAS